MDEEFFAMFFIVVVACIGKLRTICNVPDRIGPLLHWYVWAVVFMVAFYARGYWDWWNFDRIPLTKLQNNQSATYNEVYGNHSPYHFPDLPENMDAAYKDQLSLAGGIGNQLVISLARTLPSFGWAGQIATVGHVVEQVRKTVRRRGSWSLEYSESLAMVVILQPALFQALSMRSIIRCLELLTHSAWYGKLATEGSDAIGGPDGGPVKKFFDSIAAKIGLIHGNVHYDVKNPADDVTILLLVFRTAQESVSLANFIQYVGIGCFALLIVELMAKEQQRRGSPSSWKQNNLRLLGVWAHIVVGLILEAANIALYFQAHKKNVAKREAANALHHWFISWYKPFYGLSVVVVFFNMRNVVKNNTLDLDKSMKKFLALRGMLMVAAVLPNILLYFQCAGDNIANTPPMNSTCQIDHSDWAKNIRSLRLGPVRAELVNAAVLLGVGVILSCVNVLFWRELPTGRNQPSAAVKEPLLH